MNEITGAVVVNLTEIKGHETEKIVKSDSKDRITATIKANVIHPIDWVKGQINHGTCGGINYDDNYVPIVGSRTLTLDEYYLIPVYNFPELLEWASVRRKEAIEEEEK